MLITLFISLSEAVIQQCIASSKIAKIPSDYKLIQYHVITNSGLHSPKNTFLEREKRGFWNCDSQSSYSTRTNIFPVNMPRSFHSILDKRYSEYPPNCCLNDLTVEGMNQLHDLGLQYRKKILSTDEKFLSETKISQKILVRSTYEDNSFRNAASFLTGLFNDEKVDDLEIITGTKSKEIIVANEKYCKDIKKLISEYESSDEFQEILSKARKDLKYALSYLNNKKASQSSTKSKIINACDFIISTFCSEQITSLNISEELYEKAMEYYIKLSFDSFSTVSKKKIGIAASSIIREIMHTINNTIENKEKIKFSLFSGDDSSIAAILSLMKKKVSIISYASHISVAVLKKDTEYYLQIALNGEPLELPTNEKSIFTYNDFCNYVINYIDFCH